MFNAWMDQGFKPLSFNWITKHNGRNRLTIHFATLTNHT